MSKSRRSALVALTLVLSALLACAGASHTQLGAGLYSIECRRGQANCYEEAAAVCPGGFDVQDSATQTEDTPKGSMLIRCRKPNAP
jgi:hypothetical protein